MSDTSRTIAVDVLASTVATKSVPLVRRTHLLLLLLLVVLNENVAAAQLGESTQD